MLAIRPRRLIASILAASSLALSVARVTAQCEVQKLRPASVGLGDRFGYSVSASHDVVIVGAINVDCAAGYNCGAAYVYRFNGQGWLEEQQLTSFDPASGDWFGHRLSVSGDVAVVGARLADCVAGPNCGAAYVFRFNGCSWIEEQKLSASDSAAEDSFGISISVSQNVALVGAFYNDCAAGADCGAVYAYRFNGSTWDEEEKLTAPDAAPDDRFGISVSVSGDVALIGALSTDCFPARNCGAAYVFRYDGARWVQEEKLIASDAAHYDWFGSSVAVSGDVAIVGATGDDCVDVPNASCGAAYIYRFNGSRWEEEQKLVGSDARRWEGFGSPVSVSVDTAMVGSGSDACPGGTPCGAVYVYGFDGARWIEQRKLTGSDTGHGDLFGSALFVGENLAVVGAQLNRSTCAYGCGAAYVFALGPDCNGNGQADLCDIRNGGALDEDQDGIPDECDAITAVLDIKPGACPNPFNPKGRGVIPMALVGSDDFDVTEVDTESLLLKRADRIGGSLRPLSGPPGPGLSLEGVATPVTPVDCQCHDLTVDGLEDLIMKFSTPDLVEALDLACLAPGMTVKLTLTGLLMDGTPFQASDCIHAVGPRAPRPLPPESQPSLTHK